MQQRQQYEEVEEKILAPYAQKSGDTKGRIFSEEEHPYRPVYQRDRDRIVHCRAFRRLEYKTQVFVNHEGDHYRTRLTHSMEVATIGRSIARALRLNEDLVEAIALAHDVGHPPFGHAGESTLNELMKNYGGFEHNRQSLRVVDKLEKKYPQFDGLNLTWEVREGIIKHKGTYDSPESAKLDPQLAPTLEAQIVDVADETAYNSHDIDDGLASGYLSEDNMSNINVWKEAYDKVKSEHPNLNDEIRRYFIVRFIIDRQVRNVIDYTEQQLKNLNIKTVKDVRKVRQNIISFDPVLKDNNEVLKEYLYENLYNHYRVEIMNQKGRRILKELFNLFTKNPKTLSPTTTAKIEESSLHRVICDYIAGMTDRYAIQEYRRLCDLSDKI